MPYTLPKRTFVNSNFSCVLAHTAKMNFCHFYIPKINSKCSTYISWSCFMLRNFARKFIMSNNHWPNRKRCIYVQSCLFLQSLHKYKIEHKISTFIFTHNYHSTLPLCITIITDQITPIHQIIFTHLHPTLFFVIYFCVINFETGCNA